MTKWQMAVIVIVPLLIVVIMTAVNRWWGWETDGARLAFSLTSVFLLVFYFTSKNKKQGDGSS